MMHKHGPHGMYHDVFGSNFMVSWQFLVNPSRFLTTIMFEHNKSHKNTTLLGFTVFSWHKHGPEPPPGGTKAVSTWEQLAERRRWGGIGGGVNPSLGYVKKGTMGLFACHLPSTRLRHKASGDFFPGIRRPDGGGDLFVSAWRLLWKDRPTLWLSGQQNSPNTQIPLPPLIILSVWFPWA